MLHVFVSPAALAFLTVFLVLTLSPLITGWPCSHPDSPLVMQSRCLFLTMGNNIPALHPVLGLNFLLTNSNRKKSYYALYLKAKQNICSNCFFFLLDLFMKLFSNQILRCKLKIAFTDTYSIKTCFPILCEIYSSRTNVASHNIFAVDLFL